MISLWEFFLLLGSVNKKVQMFLWYHAADSYTWLPTSLVGLSPDLRYSGQILRKPPHAAKAAVAKKRWTDAQKSMGEMPSNTILFVRTQTGVHLLGVWSWSSDHVDVDTTQWTRAFGLNESNVICGLIVILPQRYSDEIFRTDETYQLTALIVHCASSSHSKKYLEPSAKAGSDFCR